MINVSLPSCFEPPGVSNLPDDFDDDAEDVEVEGIFFEFFSLSDADGNDKNGQVGEL
jgi:hypothetical protein